MSKMTDELNCAQAAHEEWQLAAQHFAAAEGSPEENRLLDVLEQKYLAASLAARSLKGKARAEWRRRRAVDYAARVKDGVQ